ncbi:MAG: VOC family protein [Chloroflexi bacterium]|nr:VOC family protein [Chloroflexota bacterium]
MQRIGNVFYRAPDMDAAVHFYVDVLGFALKFRDADHWAAFDVAGMTLAIEGGAACGNGGATVSLRVEGLAETIDQLRTRGASVSDLESGPHERRATLTDPAGNTLVLYEPA